MGQTLYTIQPKILQNIFMSEMKDHILNVLSFPDNESNYHNRVSLLYSQCERYASLLIHLSPSSHLHYVEKVLTDPGTSTCIFLAFAQLSEIHTCGNAGVFSTDTILLVCSSVPLGFNLQWENN